MCWKFVSWECCVTVSYTHLDVYKRQVQEEGVEISEEALSAIARLSLIHI